MLLLLLLPTLCAGLPRLATSVPDTAPPTPHVVNCTDLEATCLSQGKLALDGNCNTPLETGSCSEQEWIVMRNGATAEGYCSSRPCAAGEVPVQTRCLTEAAARTSLCQGAALHLDPRGLPRCGPHPGWPVLLAKYVRCSPELQKPMLLKPSTNSSPFLSFKPPAIDSNIDGRSVDLPRHKCGANDNNECVLEVTGSSPSPDLQSES